MIETDPKPTKVVMTGRSYNVDGNEYGATERTYDDLCSVELGATAKGDTQIKSVKVYAATAEEAAKKALVTFNWLQDTIRGEMDGEDQ